MHNYLEVEVKETGGYRIVVVPDENYESNIM